MPYSKNKSTSEDKTKELLEKLENGIKATLNSERYRQFLKFQSQFHNYSFNNQILIFIQKPDARQVAGFKAWEKFDRHVIKGEKGISILAPNPYKYEKEVDKIDPKTKQLIRNPKTGEIQKEKVIMQGMKFRKVTVFDVKQTAGKELPDICKELKDNSINAEKIINAIKQFSTVPIKEEAITSGAKGYYTRDDKEIGEITINKGMSTDQTAKTLIHEYSHSQLHNTSNAASLDRATKEVQAESVAYIVSNRFGVDTSQYSFDYLANWSSDKDLTELKKSFDLIQKTADRIISKIENVINQSLELQNSSVKITILWSESDQLQKGRMYDLYEANKIFQKLEKQQRELRRYNEKEKNNKYLTYHKTQIKVDLSDGRVFNAKYDIGSGEYNDLSECIKSECYLDVAEYVKDYELKHGKNMSETTTLDIKEKIIDLYTKELPSIRHIANSTAEIIHDLNEKLGDVLSIKNIKELHNEVGKRLEFSNAPDDVKIFKDLSTVIEDFKHSTLIEKQNIAHDKAITQFKDMEMVQ